MKQYNKIPHDLFVLICELEKYTLHEEKFLRKNWKIQRYEFDFFDIHHITDPQMEHTFYIVSKQSHLACNLE